jgi:hypothetical protein
MKIISRVLFVASFVGVALAGEWNCADTSGVFTRSTDCTLSSEVVVTGSLNITGIPDANDVLPKIIGGGSNRLFKVENGGELAVKSLNLTGGVASGSGDTSGGAVKVDGATSKFEAIGCTFSGNIASGVGGGCVCEEATCIFSNSTIEHNVAGSEGGGVMQYYGNTVLTDTTISYNDALDGAGGIRIYGRVDTGQTAISTLTRCTIKGNRVTTSSTVSTKGGAGMLVLWGSLVTIRASSFVHNDARAHQNVLKGDELMAYKHDSLGTPTIKLINVDFSSLRNDNIFGGYDSSGSSHVYTGTESCTSAPTQCKDNGYPSASCTTRQNANDGVICAQNCSAGYQKAGTLNQTCAACPAGKFSSSWNQYQCQSWSECSSGQYISTNGTSSSDRVCSSCPPQQFSTHDNAYACTGWTDCVASQYVSSNGTSTTDRVCTPCGAGAYSASANEDSCAPWTNCTASQYISTNGTSSVDRVCSSCMAGKYSADANEGSCTAWSDCVAGQKIAANGTATTDRTCVACPTGQFSAATNQNACTNWTTCNATTEVESSAGSATADRVCALAGSPSPSDDSPSPSDDSPSPSGDSPSPSGDSPSPAADSPAPAANTSTTDVPNKLSAASSYRPQLYLCGVLMLSIWFCL